MQTIPGIKDTVDPDAPLGSAGIEGLSQRKLEIQGQHGRLHFDTDDLEEAARRYRQAFAMSNDEEIRGRVQSWKDGAECHDWKPLHVELASIAELRQKSKVQTPRSAST